MFRMPSGSERIPVVASDPAIIDRITRQSLQPLGYDERVVGDAARGLENALAFPRSARDNERSQMALLDSLRAVVQDKIRVATYPLEVLASAEWGMKSANQREVLATI
jgi:hypothetical protein